MDKDESLAHDSLVLLRVKNFQSLKDVEVKFGRFTVFVGPSSSGKSAVLRAIRAVVRNVSSPAAVSYGQSAFQVEAVFGDSTVSVVRGKGKSLYVCDDVEYPKAGVSVPQSVELALRVPLVGGQEVSLSDQFDRPFLLGETGSVAAKVLGELTNASLLIEAAREANRRRQSFSRVAGLREADVSSIRSRLGSSQSLPEEKERLTGARRLVDRARDLSGEVDRLSSALEVVQIASQVVERSQAEVKKIPDVRALMGQASASMVSISRLRRSVEEIDQQNVRRSTLLKEAATAQEEAEKLRQQEKEILRQLGRCPFCGQPTEAA